MRFKKILNLFKGPWQRWPGNLVRNGTTLSTTAAVLFYMLLWLISRGKCGILWKKKNRKGGKKEGGKEGRKGGRKEEKKEGRKETGWNDSPNSWGCGDSFFLKIKDGKAQCNLSLNWVQHLQSTPKQSQYNRVMGSMDLETRWVQSPVPPLATAWVYLGSLVTFPENHGRNNSIYWWWGNGGSFKKLSTVPGI